ncbi:hypothetical protein PRIPAC_91590 [Pristionchus pacificus]|uniref:Uncharacterized protein n=1 Tax=Pristionchus pacificus TaxID=54126 RepID=A0A2A6BPF7_PRIPA|nr:hypothetical protein PRIPAC_91590 [Pristionchus pacificus]|eukprot:PDM67794.1 hypothetical protein PRIPAC_45838 [Pristionchus pacificus]
MNTSKFQQFNDITGNLPTCNCAHTEVVSNSLLHEATYSRYRCSRCRRHGVEAVKTVSIYV